MESRSGASGLYLFISELSGAFGSHISGTFLQSQSLPFKESRSCQRLHKLMGIKRQMLLMGKKNGVFAERPVQTELLQPGHLGCDLSSTGTVSLKPLLLPS